jgi:hypothetical protein
LDQAIPAANESVPGADGAPMKKGQDRANQQTAQQKTGRVVGAALLQLFDIRINASELRNSQH